MFDLVVIGGGPAGLTASIYAMRQRLNVLLVTENLGGKTLSRVQFPDMEDDSVIRGRELVDSFKNELGYLDLAHRIDRVVGVEERSDSEKQTCFLVSTQAGERLETRAVLVASGCLFPATPLPGAKQYLLKGIGTSAASYAHLFLDRRAVVIGNGARALGAALQLAYSAERVFLIPEQGGPLNLADSDPVAAALLERSNVTVLDGHTIKEFRGDGFAREMITVDPDGQEKVIQAAGFFIENETTANSAMVKDLVERDSQGYIVVDSRNRTSRRGIFAAGDVTDVHREQVLVAIGEGAKAALSVQELLFQQQENS